MNIMLPMTEHNFFVKENLVIQDLLADCSDRTVAGIGRVQVDLVATNFSHACSLLFARHSFVSEYMPTIL